MIIGDWKIEVLKEELYTVVPTDPKSPSHDEKMVTYSFFHNPTSAEFTKIIQYLKLPDEAKILEALTQLSTEMSRSWIPQDN